MSWFYSLPFSFRKLCSLIVWTLAPIIYGLVPMQHSTLGDASLCLMSSKIDFLTLIYFPGWVCIFYLRPLPCSLFHLSYLSTSTLCAWFNWRVLLLLMGYVNLVVWYNWFPVMLIHPWRLLFVLVLLTLILFSFLLLSLWSRPPPCFTSFGSGVGFWVAGLAVYVSLVGVTVGFYVFLSFFLNPLSSHCVF